MKLTLLLLAILGLAAPLTAQTADEAVRLEFQVTGSVLFLGNPLAGGFSVLPTIGGKGPRGQVTGQGLYSYRQLVVDSQGHAPLVCEAGQFALRIESTGDMLLLQVMPGQTGMAVMSPTGGISWTQTWTGTVVGGTGRFAGATGTYRKVSNGFGAYPGLVHPWEGTLEVVLDR